MPTFLNRAHHVSSGTFHNWISEPLPDPTMAQAIGPQTPPHPVLQYSDFVSTDIVCDSAFSVGGLGFAVAAVMVITGPAKSSGIADYQVYDSGSSGGGDHIGNAYVSFDGGSVAAGYHLQGSPAQDPGASSGGEHIALGGTVNPP